MEESAQIVREMIRHEDNLANNRLGWLNTVQGLLFAALALAFGGEPHNELIPLLAGVGFMSGAMTFALMLVGTRAKQELLSWWKERAGKYSGVPVVGYLPALKKEWIYIGYFSPANFLPLLFMVAWFVVATMFWG